MTADRYIMRALLAAPRSPGELRRGRPAEVSAGDYEATLRHLIRIGDVRVARSFLGIVTTLHIGGAL